MGIYLDFYYMFECCVDVCGVGEICLFLGMWVGGVLIGDVFDWCF